MYIRIRDIMICGAFPVLYNPVYCRYRPSVGFHDDVIKWKHFPLYWPFVRGIHRLSVNFQHKGQIHGALMFSLICACINGWVNDHEAGDLRCHRAHFDVTVMHLRCDPCNGLKEGVGLVGWGWGWWLLQYRTYIGCPRATHLKLESTLV